MDSELAESEPLLQPASGSKAFIVAVATKMWRRQGNLSNVHFASKNVQCHQPIGNTQSSVFRAQQILLTVLTTDMARAFSYWVLIGYKKL